MYGGFAKKKTAIAAQRLIAGDSRCVVLLVVPPPDPHLACVAASAPGFDPHSVATANVAARAEYRTPRHLRPSARHRSGAAHPGFEAAA